VLIQGAGAVGGQEPARSVLLRTSPIITLVDVLFRLIKFAIFKHIGVETSVVADWVWNGPFHLDTLFPPWSSNFQTTQGLKRLNPSTERLFDRTWWATVVFFIVCSLTQGAKLFGTRGIVFTQVIAGIYIFAFLSTEVLRLMPIKQKHRFISTSHLEKMMAKVDNLQRHVVAAGCVGQIALWYWTVFKCVPNSLILELLEIRLGIEYFVLLAVLILLNIVSLISLSVYSRHGNAPTRRLQIAFAIVSFISLLYYAFGLLWMYAGQIGIPAMIDNTAIQGVLAVIILTGLQIVSACFSLVLYAVQKGCWCFPARNIEAVDLWFIMFAISNMATFFIYYRLVYDSERSYTPGWMNRTG
jgi:hypothetical protein